MKLDQLNLILDLEKFPEIKKNFFNFPEIFRKNQNCPEFNKKNQNSLSFHEFPECVATLFISFVSDTFQVFNSSLKTYIFEVYFI